MLTETDTKSTAHGKGHFEATINTQPVRFEEATPSSRQMLKAANFVPADDCVLIQVLPHGTRAIGLDETVDLRQPGVETFWAFRTDRVFRFTVDERGFDWGAGTIKEPVLRAIAHVK